jgi:hypothetical protein
MKRPERRGWPRVSSRLPIALADQAEELVSQTKNVSASGAYCRLSRFVAPMTKLQIRFRVPVRPQPTWISCEGVIVRVEPPRQVPRRRSYDVAIFFTDLAESDRAIVARYVQQRLRTSSPASVHR